MQRPIRNRIATPCLVGMVFAAQSVFVCPANAQTALETVAYIVFNADKTKREYNYQIVGQSDNDIDIAFNTIMNAPVRELIKITRDTDCRYSIKGDKSNSSLEQYDITIDFTHLRNDAVSTESVKSPLNVNGIQYLLVIPGVEFCRSAKSPGFFYNDTKNGACSSVLKREVYNDTEWSRKQAALKYLESKYCKVSAF